MSVDSRSCGAHRFASYGCRAALLRSPSQPCRTALCADAQRLMLLSVIGHRYRPHMHERECVGTTYQEDQLCMRLPVRNVEDPLLRNDPDRRSPGSSRKAPGPGRAARLPSSRAALFLPSAATARATVSDAAAEAGHEPPGHELPRQRHERRTPRRIGWGTSPGRSPQRPG